jgi:hypothetical protein
MVTDPVVFDVTVENKVYHVNDTVRFLFSGNAQNIVFYSGLPGNNYANKDRVKAVGKPELEFTSFLNYAGETNTLKLLASADFSGKMDSAGIYGATWTDITARAALATTAADKLSGVIDLTEFKEKPVYLAFKYLGYKHATLKQPKWTIKTFVINNTVAAGVVLPVTATSDLGWTAFDLKNPTTVWALPSTGVISIDGTTVSAGVIKLNDDNEDWAISRKLDLQKAIPDAGLPLRHLGSNALDDYSYIYTQAGTYEVTFVAFNNTIDDQQTVVRKMTITIVP